MGEDEDPKKGEVKRKVSQRCQRADGSWVERRQCIACRGLEKSKKCWEMVKRLAFVRDTKRVGYTNLPKHSHFNTEAGRIKNRVRTVYYRHAGKDTLPEASSISKESYAIHHFREETLQDDNAGPVRTIVCESKQEADKLGFTDHDRLQFPTAAAEGANVYIAAPSLAWSDLESFVASQERVALRRSPSPSPQLNNSSAPAGGTRASSSACSSASSSSTAQSPTPARTVPTCPQVRASPQERQVDRMLRDMEAALKTEEGLRAFAEEFTRLKEMASSQEAALTKEKLAREEAERDSAEARAASERLQRQLDDVKRSGLSRASIWSDQFHTRRKDAAKFLWGFPTWEETKEYVGAFFPELSVEWGNTPEAHLTAFEKCLLARMRIHRAFEFEALGAIFDRSVGSIQAYVDEWISKWGEVGQDLSILDLDKTWDPISISVEPDGTIKGTLEKPRIRLAKLAAKWAVLADRGFANCAASYPHFNTQITPAFLSGRAQFEAAEVSQDRRNCQLRYGSETNFSRVTDDAMLRDVIPRSMFKHVNHALHIAHGMANLRMPFYVPQDDYFDDELAARASAKKLARSRGMKKRAVGATRRAEAAGTGANSGVDAQSSGKRKRRQ